MKILISDDGKAINIQSLRPEHVVVMLANLADYGPIPHLLTAVHNGWQFIPLIESPGDIFGHPKRCFAVTMEGSIKYAIRIGCEPEAFNDWQSAFAWLVENAQLKR